MKALLDVLICTYGEAGIERIASHCHPHVDGVRYVVSAQGIPAGYTLPARMHESDFKITYCPGKGLSRNRNHALREAEAPLAMIADDDLDFEEQYFETIFRAYRENPDIDVITFTYESANYPKRYPSDSFRFEGRIPKGYFVTSFEITFRTSHVKNLVWFNEKFGIGAKYPCGEEDLFIHTLRQRGLRVMFMPLPIARHDGSTTSEREMDTPLFIRTKGAVMVRLYPLTWGGRMLTHAIRHAKERGWGGMSRYIWHWLAGTIGMR